jgi:hypothetical protein
MRVNDPNASGLPPGALTGTGLGKAQETGRTSRAGWGGRGEAAGEESPDRVALSDLSGRVRELAADSPERVARLEKLSADVRAGRYEADPLELSRRLIEETLKPLP